MHATVSTALAAEHARDLQAEATADERARQARQARRERRARRAHVRHEITARQPKTAARHA